MPAFLDKNLLGAFETRLRAAHAPIVDAWRPGLTDEQIDAIAQPAGIDMPEEARIWWRWHDGVMRRLRPPTAWELVPGRDLIPLVDALEVFVAARDPMLDAGYPDAMLSPVGEKPILYFHCRVTRDAPVPIYSQNEYGDPPRLVLASIGELVTTWIAYIDDGIFDTHADGSWRRDYRNYPKHVWDLGVY